MDTYNLNGITVAAILDDRRKTLSGKYPVKIMLVQAYHLKLLQLIGLGNMRKCCLKKEKVMQPFLFTYVACVQFSMMLKRQEQSKKINIHLEKANMKYQLAKGGKLSGIF